MNPIEKAKLFDALWEIWENKDKEYAARKALKVLVEQEDISSRRLIASANIYCLEHAGSKYFHSLGNWIRDDIWKDIYYEFRDVEEYEQKLIARKDACQEVIDEWNRLRLDWWSAVRSNEDRIPIVEFALRNKAFADNWREALSILRKVFSQRLPETDWRSKITPSISWFCRVEADSHTALKAVEGDFGSTRREGAKVFDPASLFKGRGKPLESDEAIEETKKLVKNIFQKKKHDNLGEASIATEESRNKKIPAMFRGKN